MKLIFIDHLGCYAAVLAASYQTGKIGGQPSRQQILRLSAFADYQDIRPGDLREFGKDAGGNQVYTLGVGCEAKIMMVSALDLLRLLGAEQDIRIIDVSSYNGLGEKVSWYLGLCPYLKQLSRIIAAASLQKKLPQLFASLNAEPTGPGLEYSDLDLESQDQG